jgi:hypothetical protein
MSDQEYDYYSETDSDSETETKKLLVSDIKYPLKDTWTIYDHVRSNNSSYDANTREIGKITSVIQFWNFFNHYPNPSVLFHNGGCKPTMGEKEISSISVFKNGILPKWEDPVNKFGAEVSKRKFDKKNQLKELDENWIDILMACIGEQIDPSVTGIRVVDSSGPKRNNEYSRKNTENEFNIMYRIELWFDSVDKKEIIEEQFKNILTLDSRGIYYKEHSPKNE